MSVYLSCAVVLIALYCNLVMGKIMNDAVQNEDEEVLDIENETETRRRFNIMYPETKWCGVSTIAENYEDLGKARKTDKCCREHASCTDFILGGETKYNLTNEALYTRFNCACDEALRLCLDKIKTRVSVGFGKFYFGVLGIKCFRRDYPVIRCKNYGGSLKNKCLEYEYDTSKNQIYQWFDVKNWSS